MTPEQAAEMLANQVSTMEYLLEIDSWLTFITTFGFGIAILLLLWWVIKQFIQSYF